jgi:acetate CoA/acetoacetate CoA-transferase alpha subunit
MRTISVEAAVEQIPDHASLLVGGFMGVGTPDRVISEIVRQKKRDLTIIANDTASPGIGIGKLISAKLVHRVIASHIGLNPETQQQMMAEDLRVDLVPQGTLIERIRSGGYGLGGVLTPTGLGTVAEEGKQKIEVDGRTYLVETAPCRLRPDTCFPCRLYRQPRLHPDRAKLQSSRGDGGRYRNRLSRSYRARRGYLAG